MELGATKFKESFTEFVGDVFPLTIAEFTFRKRLVGDA
jgi:hypothetical protein